MLKVEIDHKKNIHHVEARGSIEDIMTDLFSLIGSLHTTLKQHNPKDAEFMRRLYVEAIVDPDFPVFDGTPQEIKGICVTTLRQKKKAGDDEP